MRGSLGAWLALAALACLLQFPQAHAQPSFDHQVAGRVIAARGENDIERAATMNAPAHRQQVAVGTEIRVGDTLITGTKGRMQIQFSDGAIVSLQPRTVFRIDEYAFDSSNERGFFSLVRGALRTATGKIGTRDPKGYLMRTPSATVGIRGTHYVLEQTVCDPQCHPGDHAGTRASVAQGRIVLANAAGEMELSAGQAAFVAGADEAPRLSAMMPTLGPPELPASLRLARVATDVGGSLGEGRFEERRRGRSGSDIPEQSDRRDIPDPPDSSGLPEHSAGPRVRPPEADGGRLIAENRDRDGGLERVRQAPPDSQAPAQPPQVPPSRSGLAPDPTVDPAPDPVAEPRPGPIADQTPEPTPDPDRDQAGFPPAPLSPGLATESLRIDLIGLPASSTTGFAERQDRTIRLDDTLRLQSVGACPTVACLERGDARIADAGRDEWASWGRWTDGSIEATVQGLRSTWRLSANEGVHYLVGVPAVSLPASGVFAYELSAATAATMRGPELGPGRFTGTAAVAFGPGIAPRVGLDARVEIGGAKFGFATDGGATDPARSQLAADGRTVFEGVLSTTGDRALPWVCRGGPCAVRVGGALFGPSGERLGLGYSIEGTSGSTTIEGVGVFSRTTPPQPISQ